MRSDLMWFMALRLLSGMLSFLLFALIARKFEAGQTKSLYYFLFLAGYFTSALRALATIAAALQGSESRSHKLRRACMSFGQVVCVSAAMLPVAMWVFSGLGVPIWVYGGLLILLMSWGIDIDLLRAIIGRSGLVPLANVAGALLALACLAVFRSFEGAFAAILLQWLPLCGLNAQLFYRLRFRILHGIRVTLAQRGGTVWVPLGLALFDGLIINAPFFLGEQTPPEVGRSISVVTRIFVGGLVLMPLVTFWSNSAALNQMARRLRISAVTTFGVFAVGTGLAGGAAFALAFAWIAGSTPSAAELVAVALLLLGFSAFASAARYRLGIAPHLLGALAVLAGVNALGVLLMLRLGVGALGVSAVQASTLLAATGLMALQRR